LTGKYQPKQSPPQDSRAANNQMNWYLLEELFSDRILSAVQQLKPIAQEVGVSMSQLALAWVLRSEYVVSAIIGASRPEQIVDNAAASGLKLSDEVLAAIDQVLESVIRSH
jgi:aryl-alcohol dehydrogenase-like predicted oxidoreductase